MIKLSRFNKRALYKGIRQLSTSSLPLTNKAFFQSVQESQSVSVTGWIKSVRKSKNVAFADISDGTCGTPVSIVMNNPEDAKSLSTGACVEIKGTVQKAPPAKNRVQSYEVVADHIKVWGPTDKDYPLQKKYHTTEFLRTIPEFRWKTNTGTAVMRYRSFATNKIREYFSNNDFTQVHSPIITSSDCEGGGEVFQLSGGKEGPKFFGEDKAAYLSVSSQLHLEVFTGALSRVWNIAPAFRAEDSNTTRHLSEFWIVEAEIAFITQLNQLMDIVENMIKSAVAPLLDESSPEAKDLLAVKRDAESKQMLLDRWKVMASDNWTRITYTDAVSILNEKYSQDSSIFQGQAPPTWGEGLASVHEKYLAGTLYNGPVFVTDYPIQEKPFYMLQNEPIVVNGKKEQTVSCFDLLVPQIGELVGGSMREHDYEKLLKAMNEKGMNSRDLDWYLKLRQQGSFPHGGYGMGFERFLAYVTGQSNVRDVIGFSRWAGNCVC